MAVPKSERGESSSQFLVEARKLKILTVQKCSKLPKRLNHGFTMLKKRFSFRGKRIIMKICQKSVARERKKLKKLMNKVAAGQLTVKDIYQSYQSWRSYARHGNAYRTIKNMNRFYSNLVFGGPAA